MGNCKDCKHWMWHLELPSESARTCSAPKMLKGYDARSAPSDGARVENDERWGILTGPDFGCVLFEAKEAKADDDGK